MLRLPPNLNSVPTFEVAAWEQLLGEDRLVTAAEPHWTSVSHSHGNDEQWVRHTATMGGGERRKEEVSKLYVQLRVLMPHVTWYAPPASFAQRHPTPPAAQSVDADHKGAANEAGCPTKI